MAKPSYSLGRRCLLCERRITDKHPRSTCCGVPIRETFQLQIGDQLVDVAFVRTRVIPRGRRRIGTTASGATVIWDEITETTGRSA